MPDDKTHCEKTSAEKKVVGFEYQYYFFLYRVLQLRTDESVGLEVADDVHTELDNDRQILFQLKHTLQVRADGTPAALSPLDSDLWKTMSNWSLVVSDEAAGRTTPTEQLGFVNRTDFVLTSNKSKSVDSSIPDLLADPDRARENLKALRETTGSSTIEKQIDDVLALDDSVLPLFIQKVRLDLEVDEMISMCKTRLVEMHIPSQRIEQLFRDLDSAIRQDNYLAIKDGRKIQISFSDFNRNYRAHFDSARSLQLQIRREYEPLPVALDSQTFIKQLLDIGDVSIDEVELMAELTTAMKYCERNLLRWEVEGDITMIELRQFDTDAITSWRNTFRACHRDKSIPEAQRAVQVIDKLRELMLTIRDQHLGTEFSNGQFYKLAEIPQIGFRPGWQSNFRPISESA